MIFVLFQIAATWLPWLAPLVVSSGTGAVAGYGSFRFGQGALTQRIATIERDVTQVQQERGEMVTLREFELLREDLREMRTDLREIRRAVGGR